MTDLEKAKDLVEKFRKEIYKSNAGIKTKAAINKEAKQYAIMCCYEMIEDYELTRMSIDDNSLPLVIKVVKHWQKIKKYIKGL